MATDEDAAASKVLWDYATSVVHDASWKAQMKRICTGDAPNIDKIYVQQERPPVEALRAFFPRHGFNLLQHSALQCDVPAMAQVLMRGADIEFGAEQGFSPLAMALSSVVLTQGDRARLAAVKRAAGFLLAVGANPNCRYATAAMDDPVLLLAAYAAANHGEWGLIEMLLRHGADPEAKSGSSGDTAASVLPQTVAAQQRFRRLVQRYRGQPRPPRRCPCGSGNLYVECHAEREERSDGKQGKEADPEFFCPCRSGRKYGRCCQKRGIVFHETLSNTYEQRMVHMPPAAMSLMQRYLEMRRQQSGDDPNALLFPPMYDEQGQEIDAFKVAKLGVLEPLSEAGLLDPAFYYAAEKVDFVLKGYWPEGLLPKLEMQKRMEEVNAAVDEYIALGTDPRPAIEIERAVKIAADGGPLYRRCAGCGSYEAENGQYKVCSSCKAVHYCGRDCQAQHWKAGHKRVCKTRPPKAVSRSQMAYSLGGEAVPLGLSGAELAAYAIRKLAALDEAAGAAGAGRA